MTRNRTTPPVAFAPFTRGLISLFLTENVNKKHNLLILLFVDCGNGPTSSLERILRAWNGHERKGSGCACCGMSWHDRAGNDNKSKTIPKGLENFCYYHYPLTNQVFGFFSKNALARPTQGPKRLFQLRASQERNIAFGLGISFHLKKTWKETIDMTRKWKYMKGKGHERNWKDMNGQVSRWTERKGRAMAISKPPKSG